MGFDNHIATKALGVLNDSDSEKNDGTITKYYQLSGEKNKSDLISEGDILG